MSGRIMSNIYLMACDDAKCVKVGISRNVKQRLLSIRTSCPFPVRLIEYWPIPHTKAEAAEAIAHLLLFPYRRAGEWFSTEIGHAAMVIEIAVDVCGEPGK